MSLRLLPTYVISIFLLFSFKGEAQSIWSATENTNQFALNTEALNDALQYVSDATDTSKIIEFPNANNELVPFLIEDNALMPLELAKKYPSIHCYKGVNITNPKLKISFTCTPTGIQGTLSEGNSIWILEPIDNTNIHRVFDPKDEEIPSDFTKCNAIEMMAQKTISLQQSKALLQNQSAVSDNKFRIIRTAIAATGEYSNFFINKARLQSGSVAQKKTAVMAGIVSSLNRLNAIFEKDLGLRLNLVANNDAIIYLNNDTDPFTSSSGNLVFDLLTESNSIITQVIGNNNFDLGHLLTTANIGGLAQISAPCTGRKGEGVSGFRVPEGVFFDLNLFAHELGHQFGATHTQNGDCQRSESGSAVEPGSGSTIMGYASICRPNGISIDVQQESDPYFHQVSIQQIQSNLQSIDGSPGCGISSTTVTNNLPIIGPLQNYTIPASTPFFLEATVTDTNNDTLTYGWEQLDDEAGVMPPRSDSRFGPLFRSITPTTNPRRNFPQFFDQNTTWEVLPSVSRNMTFGLIVRDGKQGGVVTEELSINVINTGAKFEVTSQNTNVVYDQNTSQIVTWNTAGTTGNGINVSNVKIELSYDGGATYNDTLLETTPNTGNATIEIPTKAATSTARIRVTAVGNIFYAISKSNFTITGTIQSKFPSISITNRQNTKEGLLLYKVNPSFISQEDITFFVKFEDTETNEEIFTNNEILYSTDGGANYVSTFDNTVVFPAGNDELIVAVRLKEPTPSGELERVRIILSALEGIANSPISSIGVITKKTLTVKEKVLVYIESEDTVNIEISNNTFDLNYEIFLYDLSGKLLQSKKSNKDQETLDLSSLSPALYIIQMNINGETIVRKIAVR